jgi:DNA-binding NarL/FixJ family response regulator
VILTLAYKKDRSSEAAMPGVEVVAEAGDGRSAIAMVEEHRPDLVIMDLSMPGLAGIEAIHRIKKKHSDIRILVLSMHVADGYVLQALHTGASGYVSKMSLPSELELAIYAVARGDLFVSPSIPKSLVDALERPARPAHFASARSPPAHR